MREAAIEDAGHWWEQEIRSYLTEEDEPWVPSRWTGMGALLLLMVGMAAGVIIGALAIDPAHPYGALRVPVRMPEPWLLLALAAGASGLAGISAWLVLRQDDDLGVLILGAVPPFRLMPLLGGLWFATLFGLEAPLIAAGSALLLMITVIVAMMRVGRLSRSACWLLLPLLGASAAALALSAGVYGLNLDAPIATLPF
ncbi:MAG TPA: tryptophan-rich sensory protein [Kofleriaceae bacterium]|nr:tryptophan-rich sensory protein [Kofleriaceae bacterium]